MDRLSERQAKQIILNAQMAAYPNRDVPALLKPMYEYIEQCERDIKELQSYRTAAPLEQVQAWARAEKEEICDNCFFKLKSEAWKFNVYPCRECKQRTKSHFTRLGGTFEL